jgi:hypothetical protein
MPTRFSLDWDSPQIDELLGFLSAIMREERKTKKPLYKFVDLGFVNRLASNRNHVIFGRRGSGKSVLLRELETRLESSRTHTVLIDVEQIAQKSYPNLIIEILLISLRDLLAHTRAGLLNKLHLSRRNLAREIEAEIRRLESLYQKPDEVKQKVLEREQKESKTEFSEEISTIQSILRLAANLSNRKATEQAIEEEATWKKIGALFNSIGNYRALINKWLEEMGYDALYILVDDFYQIDLLHQPLIADYLKRLLRGIPCYLKVATVRNRSLLFVKDNLTEAGLQAAHDYTSLDLDFSLDDFSQARNFLSTILRNVCEGRLGPLNPDSLFESDGVDALDILTEASGGNPRDFINLLHDIIATKRMSRAKTPITHSDILISVVNYYDREIKKDMERTYLNFHILNSFLKQVIAVCQENADIGFYVSNKDLKNYPAISSLIGQLADSRFIHLLTLAYDPPSPDDKPASAYVMSMGIYGEYLADKAMSLQGRQLVKKPYPKLSVSELSNQFAEQVPELVLIGKNLE